LDQSIRSLFWNRDKQLWREGCSSATASAVNGRRRATCICVLILITFYMLVVFGDMVGVQEDRPANASLLTAFHALFCLFARFFCLSALLCLLPFAKNRPCLSQ
jgi:hypothetical protein